MNRKLSPIPSNITLPNPTENQKQESVKTISNLIKEMLQTGISHEAIASVARAKFPNAKTTPRSVASMACVIKKEKVS